MSSIHANQPEHTHEDLRGQAAIDRIRSTVRQAENCFFCTAAMDGTTGARPMNVRQVDDAGHLWFLSASESHVNLELARDPSVKLYFQSSTHSDFLNLNGHAAVTVDRKRIRELWHPMIRTWFTGGEDDPRITVIEVTPTDGHYWDTKHGNIVAGIKMLVGAALGKTLDDSIEGRIQV
jgi:general stress protein 26